MKKHSIISTNEKLAQKLVNKALKFILELFVLVGRPLFIFSLTILTVALHFINITGHTIQYILKIFLKVYYLKNIFGLRKKSGVIFTASREQFKSKIRNIYQVIDKTRSNCDKKLDKYTSIAKNLLWNVEVFWIALDKFIQKSLLYIRERIQLKKLIRLLSLRISLFFISLKKKAPKPSFPTISFLKIFSVFILTTFLISFIGGVSFWYFIIKDLPSPQELSSRNQKVSTKIYDRHGTLLYNIYKDQNRTPVSLEEIPVQVRLATIAIEDAEFYSHPGFSVKGIIRAIIKNYKEDRLTGGSTITQQLVKNTLLTPEKTYIRKVKEIVLAMQVELAFSKDEILEMYLNQVSYGGTAYGIQEASRTYFGKDARYLSLAEAALLAGLPKSPTEYSPFGTNPELAIVRQKEVLNLMEVNDFITKEQMNAAENEKITLADQKTDIKAPHFVMYVRQLLEEKYCKNLIDSGGLDITTTLDYSIQTLAEKVVTEELDKLKNLNVTNAAVVVLKPQTGEILAMVGSENYFDTESDGNVNVAIRPRQPGSSIKVVNYAYALSNGMNAATIIKDSPVTFLVEGQPPYTPKNYEGNYRGSLTLRSAFAESRNIPAVRVLASYGVDKMFDLGKKMGITTWQNPGNYGLSLTLGGGEVRLLDLAQVYATVANYGKRPDTTSVLKITDLQGEIFEEFNCTNQKELFVAHALASESALKSNSDNFNCVEEQVLDPRVAYLITDILKDNQARSPTFGTNSLMIIPGHPEVAAKTGTSNNLRDNLTIGYNQDYLVAVWVGNNDNSPMDRIASGVTGATPIWNKIMTALLAKEESREWSIPNGMVKISVCPYTGTLACTGCPNKTEWFLDENKPELACSPDWFLAKEDENPITEGSKPSNHSSQESDGEENKKIKPEIIDMDKKNKPVNKKKNILGSI